VTDIARYTNESTSKQVDTFRFEVGCAKHWKPATNGMPMQSSQPNRAVGRRFEILTQQRETDSVPFARDSFVALQRLLAQVQPMFEQATY
jgi:hypothetical protein